MGTKNKARTKNRVRVIAGRWRGRRVQFPDIASIRPTPDRVRETIFNWIHAEIQDAVCMDLYAGSAILSFECLSRGAKSVIAVERHGAALEAIRRNADLLQAAGLRLVNSDVMEFLKRRISGKIEIVFVDPPYGCTNLTQVCKTLESRGWLVPGALIYLEARVGGEGIAVPGSWALLHEKRAGQVAYRLYRRAVNGSDD